MEVSLVLHGHQQERLFRQPPPPTRGRPEYTPLPERLLRPLGLQCSPGPGTSLFTLVHQALHELPR